MLTCYVVDDESHAIETLVSYIEKTPGLRLLGTSTNPLEALEKINTSLQPDITFLDVDMPELSGLDLAGLISDRTSVIFTTAFPQHALIAFEKNAADYLLKPVSFDRFLASVKKVSSLLEPRQQKMENDHIYIKTNIKGKVKRINFSDILYIESIRNYLSIHTITETYITYLTMKELEQVLQGDKFFRVHKSYMVNSDRIKIVHGSTIFFDKDISIPIGHKFKESLQTYINKKLVSSSRQSGEKT